MIINIPSLKDYITEGAALLGATLGVMNTWNAINQRRVRLRVRPSIAIGFPNGRQMFSIEVINVSAFPLTIAEVGFTLDGNRLGKRERAAMMPPLLIDGGNWPRQLHPRETVSGYCDLSEVHWQRVGRAYAKTACEEVRYGSSQALAAIVARSAA